MAQTVACPGCGAPIEFKSTASVMAVCGYCQTTVLKDANSVRDLGKMGAVLEDYSPIQIGTSGRFAGRAFSVVGRIQLRYVAGFWNEWAILFDDGTSGWFSDASGQYTITFPKDPLPQPPQFEQLRPGAPLTLGGSTWIASDVRVARCTGGQGELPFQVGPGWEARVADFRSTTHFLTLDFSDGPKPAVYLGEAVTLASLNAQLLRDPDTIAKSAGRFAGKVEALDCPQCGHPVKVAAGVTSHFLCPACHAQVDLTGAQATVLAQGAAVAAVPFALELGGEARIDGAIYTVLGALKRASLTDASDAWNEYLLYAPGRDFVWLVESDAGWQRAEVLDAWPVWNSPDRVVLDGQSFQRRSSYSDRVIYAAGSFNWAAQVGDVTHVIEFANGPVTLAAEATASELTISRARSVPLDQVRAWFGKPVHAAQSPMPGYRATARWIIIAILAINAIPLLFAPGSVLAILIIAGLAVYLPAWLLDKAGV